jgi:hypothetical protein
VVSRVSEISVVREGSEVNEMCEGSGGSEVRVISEISEISEISVVREGSEVNEMCEGRGGSEVSVVG